MSRQIVAIDIRNNTIAAVVVSTGLTGTIIEACAHTVLQPSEGDETSRLAAGLKPLFETLNIADAEAVLSLPADQTIYRTIHIPFTDEKKIRQILPFELEPSLPLDIGDLIIDYQKNSDGSPALLAIAIDRNGMNGVLSDVESSDIHPQLVLPGDYPLASALCTYNEALEDNALLLTIGAAKATLFAIVDRRIVLVRTMPADIRTESGVEALALRIRQTLTAYSNETPGGFDAQALYLSGSAFSDNDAQYRLSEALEIQAVMLDLRALAPKAETAESVTEWAPHLHDGALAMALIEAEGRPCPNFHRSGSALRNYWSTYRPYVRGPAVLLLIVLFLGLGSVLVESSILKGRVDKINAQIEDVFKSALPGVQRIKGIDALDQMRSEIKKVQSGSINAGESGPGTKAIDVLYHLSSLIPKDVDVTLDRLVLGSDGVTVSGEAAAFNVVDDVKNRLEASDFFKSVTIAAANMDKSGKMVRFKLKIEP